MIVAGPNEPLNVSVFPLIQGRLHVSGWYCGTASDSQDTLKFSALSGVHALVEKFPFTEVAAAYEQMHSGRARFRAVLTMGN